MTTDRSHSNPGEGDREMRQQDLWRDEEVAGNENLDAAGGTGPEGGAAPTGGLGGGAYELASRGPDLDEAAGAEGFGGGLGGSVEGGTPAAPEQTPTP